MDGLVTCSRAPEDASRARACHQVAGEDRVGVQPVAGRAGWKAVAGREGWKAG